MRSWADPLLEAARLWAGEHEVDNAVGGVSALAFAV
jgi:hypothetical protein